MPKVREQTLRAGILHHASIALITRPSQDGTESVL
jgi:hypothetical protein